MKPSLLLHCQSSLIERTLKTYLEKEFSFSEEDFPPQGFITDHLPLPFIQNFHKTYPQAVIYLLLSAQMKVPMFPFAVRVLEKPIRLKTLKEQLLNPSPSSTLRLNEFTLYLTNRRLTHLDSLESVILTEKETDLLKYLYQAHPHPVSREQLLEKVWNYKSTMTTHTLETHLYKLKQKLVLSSGLNLLKLTEEGYSLLL